MGLAVVYKHVILLLSPASWSAAMRASVSAMDDQGMIEGLTVFIKTQDSSMTSLFEGSAIIKVENQHKSSMVHDNHEVHYLFYPGDKVDMQNDARQPPLPVPGFFNLDA